jgi:hypothetical protein
MNISIHERDRVARQWLVSLIVTSVIAYILKIWTDVAQGKIGFDFDHSTLPYNLEIAVLLTIRALFSLAYGLLLYYCAYVKRGTAWLAFIVIGGTIGLIFVLIALGVALAQRDKIMLISFIIDAIIEVWYVYTSYRLFQVNYVLQNTPKD